MEIRDSRPALSQPGSQLVISGDDIPFGAYQAIYHKMTRKVEIRQKVYTDAYDINFGDIKNLHERLSQILKQFNVKSSRCQITHELKDDTSVDHSSFEKFCLFDGSTRSCTARINYELDFLIILPAEVEEAKEVVQRFKVNIRFDQDFPEDPNLDYPAFMRGIFFGKNVNVSIEYSDFSVSHSIQSTIDGWIDSLPTRKPNSFYKFLQKNESAIQSYIPISLSFFTISIGAIAASRIENLPVAIAIGIFSLAFGRLIEAMSFNLIVLFFRNASNLKPLTFLLVTTGDRDRHNNRSSVRKSMFVKTALAAAGVLSTIAIGIFSNTIFEKFKAYFLSSL